MCNNYMYSPLPNDKILDLTKPKAFADNNLNVAKMTISVFDRVENTVGKGENTRVFSFSHSVFYSIPLQLFTTQFRRKDHEKEDF